MIRQATFQRYHVHALARHRKKLLTWANLPHVAEFPIALECRLAHTHDLGLHTQFVGEVLNVIADESVLDAEGNPEITLIKPLILCWQAALFRDRPLGGRGLCRRAPRGIGAALDGPPTAAYAPAVRITHNEVRT